MKPSSFVVIKEQAGILFIEDLNRGGMSVTNDAERVFEWCQFYYGKGKGIRVVYRDSEGEWSEIVEKETWLGKGIGFEPWHGLDWDLLKR